MNTTDLVQLVLDKVNAESAAGKASLGDVIAYLKTRDPADVARGGWCGWDSWRGVYAELAFEPCEDSTAGEMLKVAEEALRRGEMEGYKGGEFPVTARTACNVAHYGTYGGDDDALTIARLISMFDAPKEVN